MNKRNIDYDKVDREFCKVLKATHGSGNNETVYNLIAQYDCTVDDIVGVARRTKNENYTSELAKQWNVQSTHFITREFHRKQFAGRSNTDWCHVDGQFVVALSNYKWCLPNIPDEYLNEMYEDREYVIASLTNQDRKYETDTARLCVLDKICKRLFKDKYLGDLLNGRLVKNKTLLDFYLRTNPRRSVLINCNDTISTNSVPELNMGMYHKCSDYCVYDSNKVYVRGETITRTEARQIFDLIAQIYALCLTMANEVYDNMSYDGDRLVCKTEQDCSNDVRLYTENALNEYRRSGVSYYQNNPSNVRLELFGQARALEMLLSLGLGIKVSDNAYGRSFRVSNKKLNNRIKTAYNTFVKLKTVAERKNFRKLFREQLNIIINDYMMGDYEIVELKCVEEQDKAFENSLSKPKKAKKMTKTPNGVAFDADFLSKLPTVKM